MTKDQFSITELSCEVHERHPYSSERLETKFTIPRIIEALLKRAARGKLQVSFTGEFSSEFEALWAYWADRSYRADDEGNISDQDIYDLGETMLVSQDHWRTFENGPFFRGWIRDNAPPTEEPVVRYWPIDGGSSEADPYRTGVQGRPTKRHFILAEFKRRIGENLGQPTLAAEARILEEWARGAHPEGPPTGVKSIENIIRDQYREHRKNPTK